MLGVFLGDDALKLVGLDVVQIRVARVKRREVWVDASNVLQEFHVVRHHRHRHPLDDFFLLTQNVVHILVFFLAAHALAARVKQPNEIQVVLQRLADLPLQDTHKSHELFGAHLICL